jgi:hypothetical protein
VNQDELPFKAVWLGKYYSSFYTPLDLHPNYSPDSVQLHLQSRFTFPFNEISSRKTEKLKKEKLYWL